MVIKRISYDPHILMQICKDVKDMKRNNSECRSAKCAPCLENLEKLLEEKEVIDVPEKDG